MELEIIKHSDISREDLLRVVCIKNAAWPHTIESQLKWIEDNNWPDDLHVILKDEECDYAYMVLCPVTAIVDGKEAEFVGIGNVCSKTKGQGYGGQIVSLVNEYIKNNKLSGLLFCRNHVVHFYEHYGWKVIPNNRIVLVNIEHIGVYTMCFNTSSFNKMIYDNRTF